MAHLFIGLIVDVIYSKGRNAMLNCTQITLTHGKLLSNSTIINGTEIKLKSTIW